MAGFACGIFFQIVHMVWADDKNVPSKGIEFAVGGAASTKMSNRTRKLPKMLIPENKQVVPLHYRTIQTFEQFFKEFLPMCGQKYLYLKLCDLVGQVAARKRPESTRPRRCTAL